MVKKIVLLAACFIFGASMCWASDLQMTDEKFKNWVKAQNIPGFQLDEDSFESYDNQEFSADFMPLGSMGLLSIKIERSGVIDEVREDSYIENYTEITVNGRKTIYCTHKTMNLSLMSMELPHINGELWLTTSPKKSMNEMKALLSGLDAQRTAF